MEINQYPLESFTFQDNDYYDIDFWTGSGYQTKKILGSVIKAGILAAVENIYNADGSLNGNRIVDLDGKNLNFSDNVGDSTITNEINDGSDYTTLVQDISALVLQAISGGYNSFANVQGTQINMESNDGGTNLSSMVYQAFYTEWLKQNGIQFTKIRQESGQLFIEYNDGIGNIKTFTIDAGGLKINGAYYLPNSDGTLNQILTTDGAGVTSWQNAPSTVVSWGDIVGTLADQTDLQAALDAKLNDPEGIASQYIRGDGTLADFPTLTGGGSAVSLYLNGGVSQGTILGGQYYQLSNIANLGPSADFILNADGLIAQFITDVNEPNVINIPAGNWHTEFYFSASSGGGVPNFYCEIYKYDGTAFTLLGSNSANPENIIGSAVDLYYTAVAIPETTLTPTDRIAIRVFISHAGRTITLHTQDNNLSEVITTISTGLTALNGLTDQVQYFQTGTSGTDFNISSLGDTHTFNVPTASAANTGKLSNSDWSNFDGKQEPITLTTTGTSGAATFDGTTLNVPNYSTTDTNIYNSDGTLIADRVVSMNNFGLTFNGAGDANGSQLTITSAANREKTLNFKVGSGLRWKQRVSGAEIGADAGSVLAFDYYSDAGVLKGTALQLNRSNGSVRLNNAYNLPTAAGTLGQVMRTNGSGIVSFQSLPVEIQVAASDETTPLTLGNGKVTFRMPHGMTLTEVRASLTTAQVSGAIFRIDIIQNGVSVLSTKCTIDNTERTSTSATTLPVISVSALADDSEMRVDIIQIGDGTAKGLKVTLIGTRQ
jgi:hypothetical protein